VQIDRILSVGDPDCLLPREAALRIRVYAPAFADHSRIDDDGYVELPSGRTLDDLLRHLRIPFRRGAVLLFMVNYEHARLSRILADGDTVGFLSLFSGG
jgi:molybdopterin converting factor small subunit